jgi:uncharacterized protein (TIGR03435 family)
MLHRKFVLFLLLFTSAAFAQTAPGNAAFEVATVKPSAPLDMAKMAADMKAGKMPRFGPHVDAARAEYNFMPLKDLIANAYTVKGYQVTGPSWLASTRFDIAAKMPEGATKDDAPKMLQALLADRFKLTLHRETQDHPVLALMVGKDGPKMKVSTLVNPPIDESVELKPGEMKMDTPDGPAIITRNSDGSQTINMGAKGITTTKMDTQTQALKIESSTTTMAGFTDTLNQMMQMGGGGGRPVVDKTGLTGNYQVSFEISREDLMAFAREQAKNLGMSAPNAPPSSAPAEASPAAAASDPSGSSIYSSVQKLGLKLEPSKAKIEQLIIDHVEKTPTEN